MNAAGKLRQARAGTKFTKPRARLLVEPCGLLHVGCLSNIEYAWCLASVIAYLLIVQILRGTGTPFPPDPTDQGGGPGGGGGRTLMHTHYHNAKTFFAPPQFFNGRITHRNPQVGREEENNFVTGMRAFPRGSDSFPMKLYPVERGEESPRNRGRSVARLKCDP